MTAASKSWPGRHPGYQTRERKTQTTRHRQQKTRQQTNRQQTGRNKLGRQSAQPETTARNHRQDHSGDSYSKRLMQQATDAASCICRQSSQKHEAGDGIRTHDNHVGNVVLYQLSYTRGAVPQRPVSTNRNTGQVQAAWERRIIRGREVAARSSSRERGFSAKTGKGRFGACWYLITIF